MLFLENMELVKAASAQEQRVLDEEEEADLKKAIAESLPGPTVFAIEDSPEKFSSFSSATFNGEDSPEPKETFSSGLAAAQQSVELCAPGSGWGGHAAVDTVEEAHRKSDALKKKKIKKEKANEKAIKASRAHSRSRLQQPGEGENSTEILNNGNVDRFLGPYTS